jgi:hypothetical protein
MIEIAVIAVILMLGEDAFLKHNANDSNIFP